MILRGKPEEEIQNCIKNIKYRSFAKHIEVAYEEKETETLVQTALLNCVVN
jgi:hypothetical protein